MDKIIKTVWMFRIFRGIHIFTLILVAVLLICSIVLSIGNYISKDFVPALVVENITVAILIILFSFHKCIGKALEN